MELMEFNIDGISLPLTDKKVGNIQLMEHQWEVKNAKEKLIVLDAPTGAGKTLAILLNFIEYNKNTNKSGFFLYPTNELVKDQVEAIANLLDKIGEKYAIISPEGISGEPENANYIIAQATGETLESISGISDEKTQGARLDWLLKYRTMNKSYILLTNIDTLYLVTKMKYAQPHAWRILQEFVNMFGFLSIDEFHLYSGVMYANLVYLLHLYKNSLERVVVATATHNEEGLILVEESLSTKARIIKANPKTNSTNVRKVRHPCKIKLIAAPLNIEPEEVASEVKIKEENDLECECLVIVDSVVKSHLVYEILRDKYGGSGIEVSEISGLVPKGSRKISRITVGTSAIEVGIDFKTKLLVAESKNASSLIQRLGRVARHCEGEAVLFIPALCHSKICEELEKMKKNNTEGKGISYDSFVSVIRKYIDEPEAYYMFAKSKYGGMLFAGILASIISASNKCVSRAELEELWNQLRPGFLPEKPEERYLWKTYWMAVADSGARGDMLSVPAMYSDDYLRVSIFDIPRLEFKLLESKNVQNLPSWIKEKWILDVSGFKLSKRKKLTAYFKSNCDTWPSIIETIPKKGDSNFSANFRVCYEDSKLESAMNKLLHGKFVVKKNKSVKADWRLNTIENDDKKSLIVGMDSLIYCWLNSESGKDAKTILDHSSASV